MLVMLKQFSISVLLIFSLLSLSLSNPENPDFTTLLAFKLSSDTSDSLSSWSNSSDHCSWLGVKCNPSTHRVAKLVLNQLNLTGSIQLLTRLTHLRHLSLHHNHLSSTPANLATWRNLKHLYLAHNRFAGNFPAGISNLTRLRRLDLSYNYFSGVIPMNELTQLPHLLTLRLESNSFTGGLSHLDSNESSSDSISDFNVSGNHLAGKIPNWLSKFPAASFSENQNLCGKPLPSHCSIKPLASNRNGTAGSESVQIRDSGDHKRNLNPGVVLTIITVDVAAIVATVGIVTYCCYKRRYRNRYRERKREAKSFVVPSGVERENEEMVFFEGCKGFTKVDELLKASAEMLGKGSVGTTYKVVMDGGDVVVVKRVRERRKRKEVDGLLREIGGLRHPNVVGLRACHSSKDELLLVYDFLPNGSLHSLLHGNRGPGRTPLDWTTRLNFASGSAQALAFLHSHNKSKLFHGHLTSSNIIVDHLGNACISDIGLHQLLPLPSSSNNAYKAPELILNNNINCNHPRKFLQGCDVYSFGVVLVEILTGKIPTSEGETSLVRWVQRAVGEEWTWEVFDFELLRYKEMEEEMVALLQVALLCLAHSPRDRPKMSVVHRMIEDIRTKGGKEGRSQNPLNYLSSDSSSLSESIHNFISS
ncbi:probable leucine-rich repeat receptor-like protein kinase At1g68400 [Cornus florida]|uniref:probable leucine-rich repeat receptor-like protein kinase At1g68400 n=1 Tax=Cornus florida TaxID=4283 RepID=UPI00289F0ACB|nr:probable leucine-rich repeat receptor-like protein kinase At1g68400 [Cornus florida]